MKPTRRSLLLASLAAALQDRTKMANRFFVLTRAVNDNRVDDSVVADYVFLEEGGTTVTDIVGGSNLELSNRETGSYEWISGLGVGVDGLKMTGGIASTVDSVIQTACRASNEISIEAWITPTNLTQGASWPARIVTMAPDPNGSTEHNFMVGMGGGLAGQEERVYGRMRTSDPSVNDDGDLNGQSAFTGNGILTTVLHHVVMTFGANTLTIYVDGVIQYTQAWPGIFSNWATGEGADVFLSFGLGNEFGADRQFLGTYHRVAVHSRALNAAEVSTNFAAGPLGGGELPPPNISFDTSFDNAFESIGAVAVNVLLSRPAGDAGVAYTVSANGSSTMLPTEDYTLSSSGFIAAGLSSDAVTTNVVNDSVAESTESLVLDLASSAANPSGITQYTLTIEDDDTEPGVSFSTGDAGVQATSAETSFSVSLDRPFSQAVTIPFTTSGSASGVDPIPDLVIAAGGTSGLVTVSYGLQTAGNTLVIDIDETGLLPAGVFEAGIVQKTLTFSDSAFQTITPGAPDATTFSLSPGDNFIATTSAGGWAGAATGLSAPAGDFTQQPYRTYLEPGKPDSFVLSIFAGHWSGMSHVTFKINGGTEVQVSQMELDTDFAHKFFEGTDREVDSKGIEVYGVLCKKADFPKGRYKCLANKVGMDGSIEQIDLEFWTDPDGDDGREVRYVRSGSSGSGLTENDPSGFIGATINGMSAAQSEGAIIYLMPGPTITMEGNITPHDNDRAIDIRNHHTAVRADLARLDGTGVMVQFGGQSDSTSWPRRVGFDGVGCNRLTLNMFYNATFRSGDTSNNTDFGNRILFDHYYWTATGTSYNQAAAISATTPSTGIIGLAKAYHIDKGYGIYLSNGITFDACNGGNNVVYSCVNTEQDTLGGSAWRHNSHILNCHAWNGRTGSGNAWHPDSFHYIVFDRQLYRGITRKGWTASQCSANSCPGQMIFVPHAIDDLIISNCMVLHPQPSVHSSLIVPGRYTSGGAVCNGFVLAHYSQPWNGYDGQGGSSPPRIPDGQPGGPSGGWGYPDSQFRQNHYHGIITAGESMPPSQFFTRNQGHHQSVPSNPNGGPSPDPGYLGYTHTDVPVGGELGSGNPIWVDPAVTFDLNYNFYPNADYTPKSGGLLANRIPTSHKFTPRYDMLGQLRGTSSGNTAVGPLRGQDEIG